MCLKKNLTPIQEQVVPGKLELSSGKQGTLVFVGAIIVAGVVLSTVVFPFWNLIREDVYEEVTIISNDGGICYVETSDMIPKTIEDCMFESGQVVTIKFGKGLAWAAIVE